LKGERERGERGERGERVPRYRYIVEVVYAYIEGTAFILKQEANVVCVPVHKYWFL
jgi:hypothetical protein